MSQNTTKRYILISITTLLIFSFLIPINTIEKSSAKVIGETKRASVSSSGEEGNSYSNTPSISGDGRYITFYSDSDNLVENDTNGDSDIFVHDRTTGETKIVSVSSGGIPANSFSLRSDISTDGRYVTFDSYASNLINGDTNNKEDIFVFDNVTNEISRVSVNSYGTQGSGASSDPSISGNGQLIAFESYSYFAYDTNSNCISNASWNPVNCPDIYLHDRISAKTTMLSVSTEGIQGDYASTDPDISKDGRFVVFTSQATNLDEGEYLECSDIYGSCADVFIHDIQTGTTKRVSVDSNGNPGNRYSYSGSVSENGRYVAFGSESDNLVVGDTNNSNDVFLHDTHTGITKRVSISSQGNQANGNSGNPDISADGRYITFSSAANNLVAGDNNGNTDIFIHDTKTGVTNIISKFNDQILGNDGSWEPVISDSGEFIAFDSRANNLVIGDTNNVTDVFVNQYEIGLEKYSISGRVLDSQGNPIPDVVVWAGFPSNAITNSNGYYLINDLYIGVYNLHAEKEGYHFNPISKTVGVPPNAINQNFTGFTEEECNSTKDTDEDGLKDGWEICGYDENNDGVVDVDLPRMGADYRHKDIFVEIDYMEADPSESKNHQPDPNAIEQIVNSFNNAPIDNPDHTTGIHLHVDFGDSAPLRWGNEVTWDNLSRSDELGHLEYIVNCPNGDYDWTAFNIIKNARFEKTRIPIFHYNLWVDKLCEEKATTSGLSRGAIGGSSDFIVSLGSYIHFSDYINIQAGTFMHELGHNLGLLHGGNENDNHKPNYLSVMNYSFQRKLITSDFSRFFDYSRWNLSTLEEKNLDETVGIQMDISEPITYGTIWYCNLEKAKMTTNFSQVDWNCDGDDSDKNLVKDINKDELEISLTSYNDWKNIIFKGGAIGASGIGVELPNITKIDEMTIEDMQNIPTTTYIYIPSINR